MCCLLHRQTVEEDEDAHAWRWWKGSVGHFHKVLLGKHLRYGKTSSIENWMTVLVCKLIKRVSFLVYLFCDQKVRRSEVWSRKSVSLGLYEVRSEESPQWGWLKKGEGRWTDVQFLLLSKILPPKWFRTEQIPDDWFRGHSNSLQESGGRRTVKFTSVYCTFEPSLMTIYISLL